MIGNSSFFYCGEVTQLRIPASVEYIGGYAFSHMTKLTHLYFDGLVAPMLDASIIDTAIVVALETFDFDGLLYIPCEATIDSWLATDVDGMWNPVLDRIKETCPHLKITHRNLDMAGYEKTCSQSQIKSIIYKRIFTPGQWETLYLPFEIESMTVEEEGIPNLINDPWDIDGGGYFYLATLDGEEFAVATTFQKNTPYIIQFVDDYYRNRVITFSGKQHSINTSFSQASNTSTLSMHGNTTLQNQSINNVYCLNNNNNFELKETTTTLYPFECYITPEITALGASPARRSIAIRLRSESDGGVTTSIPTIDADRLLCEREGNTLIIHAEGKPVSVYSINGMLLQSLQEEKIWCIFL